MRICADFWNLPFTGTGSMAGTLLHELGHFEGTDDYAYGLQDSWMLATNEPWTAGANAENYEYSSENAI